MTKTEEIEVKNKPKVSIIIPTFQRPDFIEFAVNNVLEQTYSNIEIVIVNDNGKGTNDGEKTNKVVNKLIKKYNHIIYIENELNYGIGKTRNIGINKATGEFISFLDDDDKMHKYKIATQLASINNYDLVLSCAEEMHTGNIIGRYYKKDISLKDLIKELKPIGIAASVMFRKEIFLSNQYCSDLKYAEDYDFFLNIACKGYRIGYIDMPLYIVNDTVDIQRLTQIKKTYSIEELEKSALVIKKNRKILGDFYYKKGLARVYLYNIHKRNRKIVFLKHSIKEVGFCYTLFEIFHMISKSYVIKIKSFFH